MIVPVLYSASQKTNLKTNDTSHSVLFVTRGIEGCDAAFSVSAQKIAELDAARCCPGGVQEDGAALTPRERQDAPSSGFP